MTQLPLTGAGPSAGSYIAKVRSYSPIAYWPLNEPAGATVNCLVNAAQDGAYTGVTLGQRVTDANGVTFVCPLFDGTNDYADIYSAALSSAFDWDLFSIAIWGRVYNAGVWTDETVRKMINIEETGTDDTSIGRTAANGQVALEINYSTDPVWRGLYPAETSTDWVHYALTLSKTDDLLTAYIDGASVGVDDDLRTAKKNPLLSTNCNIGSLGQPSNAWYGWLAHCAMWDSVLSAPQIADLAVP